MTDEQLYRELFSLPENLKQDVADFISRLKGRARSGVNGMRQLGLA